MIKLPIRLEVGRNIRWQTILQDALERLDDLSKAAQTLHDTTGRYIRPIMLVRVDRTGKDQRGKSTELVHVENAFEVLTQKLGVPPEVIRRQTAEVKELKDDNLLSPYSNVRIILTKDALREGWDCSFAYVLAILSKGTAATALTQTIGRVLRQPDAVRTNIEALNEAHVFCADLEVGVAIARIKTGLETEGMGDLVGEIKTSVRIQESTEVHVRFQEKFRGQRILVPRVLHRDGKSGYRELDYEADVLSCVDFEKLYWREGESFSLAAYDLGKRATLDVDIAATSNFEIETSVPAENIVLNQPLDRPALIRRMLDVVPNPWQGARILDEALASLETKAREDEIVAARLTLIEHIKRDLQRQLENAAEQVFRRKVHSGEIVFKLLAAPIDQLNFEFVESYISHVSSSDMKLPLLQAGGKPLDKALYDRVFSRDFNDFEANVALYLDDNEAVSWWWRIAARRDWGLQGWMKNKVYPDFLVRVDLDKQTMRLLVLETKGKHLEGSADTEFKTKFFSLLEQAYSCGREAGRIELLTDAAEAMRFRIVLQEQAWNTDVEAAIRA